MYAAIDIGTNTVLLLVARYDGNELQVIHEEQRTPRLGRGVDEDKKLRKGRIRKVIDALLEYRQLIDEQYPEVRSVTVTATSAVRDASNRESFIREVREKTGWRVRLLSGNEEAEWMYRGALSVIDPQPEAKIAVLDIGGGSTEVVAGSAGSPVRMHSYDMGSVRFTERFLPGDPPSDTELEKCRREISHMLDDHPVIKEKCDLLVGIAGTVTSLAYIDAGLQQYRPKRLNGYAMDFDRVHKWTEKLCSMSSGQLLDQYPKVMKGRAEVFAGGLLILDRFMEIHGVEMLTVSTGGVRHGAIVKTYRK